MSSEMNITMGKYDDWYQGFSEKEVFLNGESVGRIVRIKCSDTRRVADYEVEVSIPELCGYKTAFSCFSVDDYGCARDAHKAAQEAAIKLAGECYAAQVESHRAASA